jgi:pimeloyl-ACP methyl ester carboxylesterase
MNRHNVHEYGAADVDAQALLSDLTSWAEQAQRDPRRFIDLVESELSEPDERVVGDVVLRRLLLDTYTEALRQGAAGWNDDVLAFRKPWKIALSNITSRVRLWHGEDDRFAPVDHTRWLSHHIPQAQVEVQIQSGIGHFGAVEVLPEILSWVADGLDDPGQALAPPPSVQTEPVAAQNPLVRRDRVDRSLGKAAPLPAVR